MSCEPDGAARPKRRGFGGWLLLLVIAVMIAVYGYVAILVANPRFDEAYRRTFLTGEFGVYPTSDGWKPGDGLDYRIGTYLDFAHADMRNWLARFDWQSIDSAAVMMRGTVGRIYLHIIGETDPASRRHKLTIALVCHMVSHHATEVDVSVNGRSVGLADCGDGNVSVEADLPAGSLGVNRYDEIKIDRAGGSVFERIATRLGLRAQAVELMGMAVDAE